MSRQGELLSDMGPVVLVRRVDKGRNTCIEIRKASARVPEDPQWYLEDPEWYKSAGRCFEICGKVWLDTSGATSAKCLERSRMSRKKLRGMRQSQF